MKKPHTKLGVRVETIRLLTAELLSLAGGGSQYPSNSEAGQGPIVGTSTKPSRDSHCLTGNTSVIYPAPR